MSFMESTRIDAHDEEDNLFNENPNSKMFEDVSDCRTTVPSYDDAESEQSLRNKIKIKDGIIVQLQCRINELEALVCSLAKEV